MVNGRGTDKQKLRALGEKNAAGTEKEPEEVILKATNRAIERALGFALFFQGQDDCQVKIKTGSAGVVDDIIEDEQPMPDKRKSTKQKKGGGQKKSADGEQETGDPLQEDESTKETLDEVEDELPETQVRRVSTIEIAISLK